MSTSERETSPAEGAVVQAETTSDPELSSQPVTGGEAQEAAPLDGKVAPPNDIRQLEREIERTRERLGETVQELVAKADVKGRALAKASEMSGKYKGTMVQARNQAATRATGMRDQVARNTAAARQKAASAGKAGNGQLRGRVAAAGGPAWEAMPEQVRRTMTKGAAGAREDWVLLAVVAGAIIVGCLAVRELRAQSSTA